MAPKRPPLKAPEASGKPSTPKGGQSSNRAAKGSESQRSKKKVISTAEQLDRRDAAQKAKAKEKKAKADVAPPVEVPLVELEPITELTAPTQALLDSLQAKADEVDRALAELRTVLPKSVWAEAAPAAADAEPAVPEPVSPNTKHKVHRVWRGLAEEKLAEMASSLDGAMASDAKMRELFDHIDLDKNGSIDRHEIEVAMKAAGKDLSAEQLDKIMAATDSDGNGDIDFGEFTQILKGVKASNAATVIERQYHKHQKSDTYAKEKEGSNSERRRRRKALNKPAVAAIMSPRTAAQPITTTKEALERLLGDALVRKQADPKDLVEKWDRKRKGAITRIEFRVGVREGLGLHADNAAIDAFFEQFDKDGSGSIDVPELRDGLDWLRSRAAEEEARHATLMGQLEALKAKMDLLLPSKAAAEAAHAAVFEADAALSAHRALPHIDALVGSKLAGKLRGDDNPKGSSLEDLVAAWNVSREVPGKMNKEEFVKAVGAVLQDMTLKRQKTEASQAKLDSALTLEAKEKVRAEWAIKEVLGDQAMAAVEADFDALDLFFAGGGEGASWEGALAAAEARGDAPPPPPEGMLPIEPLIVALMAAERARVAKDGRLVQRCTELKDSALEAQAAIKQSALDFEAREKVEAEAAEAAAEAARVADEEAKAREKEAKAKAKEEAAAAPMKGAVQPRWLESAQAQPPDAASSGAPAPVDAPAPVW